MTRFSFRSIALPVFGLAGLAIGTPVLLTFASASAFFPAHDAGRADVLLLTAAVLLLPAVAIVVAILLLRSVSTTLAVWTLDLIIGVLLAALIIRPTADALRLRWYLLLAVVVTVGGTMLHRHKPEVRALMRATAGLPPLIAAWFLVLSHVSALVLPASHVTTVKHSSANDVVLVILDELPLASLLDPGGGIDTRRFPGFAALAGRSTWYRSTTTLTPSTTLDVPAILSGIVPKLGTAPTASSYPRNIFTLLGGTHRLEVLEPVTSVCAASECQSSADRKWLLKDTGVVGLRALLPERAADNWLPKLGDAWAGFQGIPAAGSALKTWSTEAQDRAIHFMQLKRKGRHRPDGRPKALVGHLLLPHFPLRYLPNGRLYDNSLGPHGLTPDQISWRGDPVVWEVARQRFLLQVKYVDRLLANMVHALEGDGSLDNAMIVVTADHGLVFQRGNRRGVPLTAEATPDALPVPLFVKYPGQTKGRIDDRPARIVDVLPTVVDALDVDLPAGWDFDGRSLMGKRRALPRPSQLVGFGQRAVAPNRINLTPAIAGYTRLFGDWRGAGDVYAWGPHWRLLGQHVPEGARPLDRRTAVVREGIGRYDPRLSDIVPALVEVRFTSAPDADWFAVAIDGVIAGLGRSYVDSGQRRGLAVSDPSYISPSPHDVRIFLVDDEGRLTPGERAIPES